jgi:hypothetical protein
MFVRSFSAKIWQTVAQQREKRRMRDSPLVPDPDSGQAAGAERLPDCLLVHAQSISDMPGRISPKRVAFAQDCLHLFSHAATMPQLRVACLYPIIETIQMVQKLAVCPHAERALGMYMTLI